jgi:hypothetical protein
VYRFKDQVHAEQACAEGEEQQLEQPRATKVVPRHDKTLFSIASILGTQNEDWLNSSFGASAVPEEINSSLVEENEDTDDIVLV